MENSKNVELSKHYFGCAVTFHFNFNIQQNIEYKTTHMLKNILTIPRAKNNVEEDE